MVVDEYVLGLVKKHVVVINHKGDGGNVRTGKGDGTDGLEMVVMGKAREVIQRAAELEAGKTIVKTYMIDGNGRSVATELLFKDGRLRLYADGDNDSVGFEVVD